MNYLKNGNLNLRYLELNDLDWLYMVENDTSYEEYGNGPTSFSKSLLKEYIQNAKEDIYFAGQLRFVIENDGIRVGMIDLFDFDSFHRRAGVGIIILKEFQQNQLGTLALKMLVNYGFEYLKLHQLYANISAENKASLKLFQNLGFNITGTKQDWNFHNNQYKNIHFLQLINANEA